MRRDFERNPGLEEESHPFRKSEHRNDTDSVLENVYQDKSRLMTGSDSGSTRILYLYIAIFPC
jgi:hypothetical protein